MKVSFDFDRTLSRDGVQKYAQQLIDKDVEVWIVTGRIGDTAQFGFQPRDNSDLYTIAERLNISKDRIHFMYLKDKAEFFIEDPDFIWHLDDDEWELRIINIDTKVKGIDVNSYNYQEMGNYLLAKNGL